MVDNWLWRLQYTPPPPPPDSTAIVPTQPAPLEPVVEPCAPGAVPLTAGAEAGFMV